MEANGNSPSSGMAPEGATQRLELLFGKEGLERIARARILVVGVGGVGSWCAESLVRSGVRRVALMDDDVVVPSNLNRQLEATSKTVGLPKVEAMAARLREVAPDCEAEPIARFYEKGCGIDLSAYDVVVDAIDTMRSKIELALDCASAGTKLFSSMGAARKLDPTQVRAASVWKTDGCPLAREVRRRLRAVGFGGDYECVYSAEAPRGTVVPPESAPAGTLRKTTCGSAAPVVAAFGLALSSLALRFLLGSRS